MCQLCFAGVQGCLLMRSSSICPPPLLDQVNETREVVRYHQTCHFEFAVTLLFHLFPPSVLIVTSCWLLEHQLVCCYGTLILPHQLQGRWGVFVKLVHIHTCIPGISYKGVGGVDTCLH